MPGEDIWSWSTTAANNDDADTGINWQEGMARAAVNDSMRSEMAAHAKARDQMNGAITTGGTANAQTFNSGNSYTVIPTGMRVLLKIGAALTNTATTTLTMDGISAVTIKAQSGADLVGGELVAGAYAEFRYDGTNWILLRSGSTVIGRIHTVVYTSGPDTYVPTPGMVSCIIECVGGGGGGGSAAATAGFLSGGGGGGGGGYSRTVLTAAEIGASQIITVGGGAAAGGTGTPTSVGTLCTATGGAGGTTGDNSSIGQGGAGGSGTGDIVMPGGQGGDAAYAAGITFQIHISTGRGGASRWGDGGKPGVASGGAAVPGNNGIAYGGGGGGATALQTASGTPAAGGLGANGVVLITEFIAL